MRDLAHLNGEIIRGTFFATLMCTFQHRYHLIHRIFISAEFA